MVIKRICWVKTVTSKKDSTQENKISIIIILKNLESNIITAITRVTNTLE